MAEDGRGLALVAACTSRWGYADAYPGRAVWAEASWPIPVPSPGQDAPAGTRRAPLPPVSRRSRSRRSRDWPSDDQPPGPAA